MWLDLKGVIPLLINKSSINLILSPFVDIDIDIHMNNIVKLCVVSCNLILFARRFVFSAWNLFCSHPEGRS